MIYLAKELLLLIVRSILKLNYFGLRKCEKREKESKCNDCFPHIFLILQKGPNFPNSSWDVFKGMDFPD